jgi:hypothetical protein
MNTANRFLASILVLAGLSLATPSRAEDVYYLEDGNRAIIVEKQLIVYPAGSKRYFALPGQYQTRDGRHTIVVTGKTVKVIRNEPQRDK